MPRFEETPQTKNNQATNAETQNQSQSNQSKPSGLLTTIGQLLPLAPFVFEQFTGQKVPQMTGTIAEMQMALINIQTNLQTIANHQQTLVQKITSLETNASNQFTNLTNQFNSFRLTHTKEKKEIDFNRPQLENTEENY